MFLRGASSRSVRQRSSLSELGPREGLDGVRPGVKSEPPATPTDKINATDPDSRNVKTPGGWVEGYNAQAVCSENEIVIADDVTVDSPDFGHLELMVAATERELAAAGIDERPHGVVADAG
jgi:hypothetical protein